MPQCGQLRPLSRRQRVLRAAGAASAVIATIGPASQDVDTLALMLEAGVTCMRMDLTVRRLPLLLPSALDSVLWGDVLVCRSSSVA